MGTTQKKLLLIAMFICASLTCPDDFSPCSCSMYSAGSITVNCNGVSGMDIRRAFSEASNTDFISELNIFLPSDCGYLPADLLSGKSVSSIRIVGTESANCEVIIDSNAFASSANFTKWLNLERLNMKNIDLAFLRDFTKFSSIVFTECSNMRALENVRTLPSSITYFDANHCTGVTNITNFPAGYFLSELYVFNWMDGDMDDAAADLIIGAITNTSATRTLRYLNFYNNSLTQLPASVSYFTNITYLHLAYNPIKVIKTGSFLFHIRAPQHIVFDCNGIENIEPAAFVGDYSMTGLDFYYCGDSVYNAFPANVFLQVLEDMYHRGRGFVMDHIGPVKCDCGLAWLIRDNRHLLANVHGSWCDNNIAFENLQPEDFAAC